MATETATRRSGRNKKVATTTPVPDKKQTHLSVGASKSKTTKTSNYVEPVKPTRKRKHPAAEPKTELSEIPVKPAEKPSKSWFLCPVGDCDRGYSVPRNLRSHYEDDHADEHAKKSWDIELALEVDFVDWLNNMTKGKVSAHMRKEHAHLLQKHDDEGVLHDQPAKSLTRRLTTEPPDESVLPEQPASPAVDTPTAAAHTAVIEDDLEQPAKKRRKLENLLESHKAEVKEFMVDELKKAKERMRKAEERAQNAEAKLERMRVERAAEKERDAELREKYEAELKWWSEENWDGRKEQQLNEAYHRGRREGKYDRKDAPAVGGFIHCA
jgi:hypothetical protein